MSKALTILSNDKSIPGWIDFELLRSEGLKHIAAFSGNIWTDHNLHDPGITILEVLCYALADLGYRNSLSIEDLLAPKPGSGKADDNFFTAAQMLTTTPITINDYRKMLMDVDGVRNAWLEVVETKEVPSVRPATEADKNCEAPKMRGLYKIILELDAVLPRQRTSNEENGVDAILRDVETLLHQHRNLCEDFDEIRLLKDEEIGLCGDIELDPDADPEEVIAEMMANLQNFLSPPIRFYTLKELLDKNKSIEEIFEGRPLANVCYQGTFANHGFIDTEELEQIKLRTELHASDLYRVMMETEGVRAVRRLKLFNVIGGARQTSGEEWCLKLTAGYRPLISGQHSSFRIFKNVLRFDLDMDQVTNLFQERISNVSKSIKKDHDLNRALPVGQHRPDLGDYRSVQHEFPLNYRIGQDQLPKDAPVERKGQKFQLKGYLMFYDQLLANYLAQVSNLRSLFAMRSDKDFKSYHFNELDDVPEMEMLLRAYANNDPSVAYKFGEVIAVGAGDQYFRSPEERDRIIHQLIRGFERGAIKIVVEETADENYQFKFTLPGTDFVFMSKMNYASAQLAEKNAEPLYFLGTLDRCYHRLDHQNAERYDLQLVNNPDTYLDYLRRITERPDQALQRRNRFLDHLLARFTEEFTDYTLIMFALEGKKRNDQEIIRDKEAFLNNYPCLSHNRSKGFNYKSGDSVWNTDNISGMERRVAGLMGIDKWERCTLCNFEIETKAPAYFSEIRSSTGELIFRSPEGRSGQKEAENDGKQMAEFAKKTDCYKRYDWASNGVFGFSLQDENGNIVALHPRTYSSPEAVQQQIGWLSKMANDDDGLLVEALFSGSGWYFYLRDNAGQAIFKSEKGYCSKEEARSAWHKFIEAAGKEAYYVKIHDPLTGMFGFAVQAPDNGPLAKYLLSFCTKKQRCQAIQHTLDFIKSKHLHYQLVAETEVFGWRLLEYEDGNQPRLIQSVPAFKNEKQAADNFRWFADLAKVALRYHNEKDDEGRHAFFVREKGGMMAARSPWFKTAKERDEAKTRVIAMIKKMGTDKTFPTLYRPFRHPAKWFFEVYDENGILTLEGLERFENEEAAQWAFYSFLDLAADRGGYQLVREEGGCRYTFRFNSHSEVLATHPKWYPNKDEAEIAIEQLQDYIIANKYDFEIVREQVKWRFEIHWENCAGRKMPLLVSDDLYNSREAAQEEANSAITAYKNGKIDLVENTAGGGFSFCLKSLESEFYTARHPAAYAEESRREKVFNRAKAVLKDGATWSVEVVEIAKPKMPDTPVDAAQTTSNNHVFRLISKSQVVATNPFLYRQASIRDAQQKRLLQLAKTGTLPYSEILRDGEIALQKDREWRFILRDKTDNGIWWQSAAVFITEEEAQTDFNKNFPEILKLARNKQRYHFYREQTKARHWKVELLDSQENPIAEIPTCFDTREAAGQAAFERRQKALAYPVKQRKKGWRIEVTDVLDQHKVLWQGEKFHLTFDEAWVEFQHFLHLAVYPANYNHPINDDLTHCYSLALREVLLEDAGEPTLETEAWNRANLFALETEQQEDFFAFEQYERGLRYGFRSVRDNYLLARHTRRYHTPQRREIALEHLYDEARCQWRQPTHLDTRFCAKEEELFFEIIADNVRVWRSVRSFTAGVEQGIRYFFGEAKTPKAAKNYYLDLIECARHAEFYQIWEEDDAAAGATVYRIGLLNMQLEPELIHPGVFQDKTSCLAYAGWLIRMFRAYPIVKVEEKYQFQYYTFDDYWMDEACAQPEDQVEEAGFLIWESVQAYNDPAAAETAFQNFAGLLQDTANYHRSTEDCGHYFSVELTDPKAVHAEHPLTYTDRNERDASMKMAEIQLNSEGFHLIEHILLRPNGCPPLATSGMTQTPCKPEQENIISYFTKGLSPGACGASAEEIQSRCYRPGADPYSFWMTVVLPWWPARFQNPDFRNFFQNTLRREAPAHVGLHILWVNPTHMALVEKKYKAWLEAINMPGDCGKCSAQTALAQALFEEIPNTNPPSFLDEPGIGNLFVLDQTYLPL